MSFQTSSAKLRKSIIWVTFEYTDELVYYQEVPTALIRILESTAAKEGTSPARPEIELKSTTQLPSSYWMQILCQEENGHRSYNAGTK